MRNSLFAVIALVVASAALNAQAPAPASAPSAGYVLPPKAIVDILDAAPPPTVELSPARDVSRCSTARACRRSLELSQPMHAARRHSHQPANERAASRAAVARDLAEVIADGAEKEGHAAAAIHLSWIGFSPDSKRFAFTQTADNGIELWIGDTATGQAKSVTPAQLNASLGDAVRMGRRRRLAALRVRVADRGQAPPEPAVPPGPNIQEHRGKVGAGPDLSGHADQPAR